MLRNILLVRICLTHNAVLFLIGISTSFAADKFLFGASQNFAHILSFNLLLCELFSVGSFESALKVHAFAECFCRHEALLRPKILQAAIHLFLVPLSLDLLHPVLVVVEIRRGEVLFFEFNWLLLTLWSRLAAHVGRTVATGNSCMSVGLNLVAYLADSRKDLLLEACFLLCNLAVLPLCLLVLLIDD